MPQKTVLITGCSEGGIGASLAAEFQLRGFRVFATARSLAKMKALADKGIETITMDVTSDASVEAAAREVEAATGGPLDYLVNNAGIHHFMPFADSRMDDFRRVINTNLLGAFAVTHACLPMLIRARGVVVNIGSVQEIYCVPYQAAYNASKAALHALSHTLRVELEPFGVRFVTVVAGGVKTKIYENAPSKMPENSLYAPLASKIENREFIQRISKVEVDDFAREVVNDLMKPRLAVTIWKGGMSTLAWILTWFGWEGMLVSSSKHIINYQRTN